MLLLSINVLVLGEYVLWACIQKATGFASAACLRACVGAGSSPLMAANTSNVVLVVIYTVLDLLELRQDSSWPNAFW